MKFYTLFDKVNRDEALYFKEGKLYNPYNLKAIDSGVMRCPHKNDWYISNSLGYETAMRALRDMDTKERIATLVKTETREHVLQVGIGPLPKCENACDNGKIEGVGICTACNGTGNEGGLEYP